MGNFWLSEAFWGMQNLICKGLLGQVAATNQIQFGQARSARSVCASSTEIHRNSLIQINFSNHRGYYHHPRFGQRFGI